MQKPIKKTFARRGLIMKQSIAAAQLQAPDEISKNIQSQIKLSWFQDAKCYSESNGANRRTLVEVSHVVLNAIKTCRAHTHTHTNSIV